ncbi:hypothetical protein ACLOJK_030415 [Asimina triloba]
MAKSDFDPVGRKEDLQAPSLPPHFQIQIPESQRPSQNQNDQIPISVSAPHKRPIMQNPPPQTLALASFRSPIPQSISRKPAAAAAAFRVLRRLRVHLRLLLLLSLPSLYFFASNPRRSVALDLLSAVAFAAAVVFSFTVALPRFPSIRLFLRRSLSFNLPAVCRPDSSPVVWFIGSRIRSGGRAGAAASGYGVQVYSNRDVYEGEFHRGKCSGSGVYYYNMSGRYEGDWIDGKYDGHGVETWAKGSRYRGQYRQGLRHGFGVYRFYTGDVYAGQWLNGQSHGCGVHTCEDGSRYVGEFKWGVKHGLGHYHFRYHQLLAFSGNQQLNVLLVTQTVGVPVAKSSASTKALSPLFTYFYLTGNTLLTRCMGLECINMQMDIGMRDPGMREEGRDLECTHLEMERHSQATGKMEARRAAEKAYSVGRVDERVNRAVAAANKAASAARVAAVKAVQKQPNDRIEDDIQVSVV